MIPPFLIEKAGALGASLLAKVSSPLVRIVAVLVVLILSNLWTWHSTTVRLSVQCERSKAEAIAEQAKEYTHKLAQVTASREEVLQELNVTRREKDEKIITIQKRLVNYERNAKKTNVPVPPDSVGMFNAISSLLPAQNAVPRSDASTGKPDESPEARVEVTRLLLAYVRAYADCASELKSLWDDYDALTRTIRNEYHIQKGDS